MKYFWCTVVLILAASAPAHAQMGAAPISSPQIGFSTLPHYPPANLQVVEFSGTASGFISSTFVSFDSAIEEGRTASQERPKTVVEAAMETRAARKERAKAFLIQDNHGNAILVRQ